MYERLWRRFITISSLLILPSVAHGFREIYYKDGPLKYNFFHLLWSNGFKNAYSGVMAGMGVTEPVEFSSLWLVCDRSKVTKDISDILGGYFSLNEWILDSEYFESIYFSNSAYIVYQLNLPEEWADDYRIIGDSRYSETSDAYKEHIRIKDQKVVKAKGMAAFVISRNLGYLVSIKDSGIKRELENHLGVKLGDQEFLPKFRKDKESLDVNLLTN